jgi:HAD superfamily hydrolase (TIGR01549 family)
VIDAVLFDLGHTLVRGDWTDEQAIAGNRVGLSAIGREGLPTPEAINAYFSERMDSLFPLDAVDETDIEEVCRQCFRSLDCTLTAAELDRYLEGCQRFWNTNYERHPSVGGVLERLHDDGLKLGLVSNNATPQRYFEAPFPVDAVVLSSEVGKRKPHPAIFRRALDELSAEQERTVFVGDRLDADVRGAAALGMRTVQAAWFHLDTDGDIEPDLVAADPLDILEWLERIRS